MAVDPAQFLQPAQERRDAGSAFRIVRGGAHERADPPHPLALLRPRPEWPNRRSAAEQRDELAALHSITSSARASSGGGIDRPRAFAAFMLMTRSNFVEARRMRVCYPSRPSARMVSCTFGLAPIRAMYALMFGHFARSILWILVQLSTVNR